MLESPKIKNLILLKNVCSTECIVLSAVKGKLIVFVVQYSTTTDPLSLTISPCMICARTCIYDHFVINVYEVCAVGIDYRKAHPKYIVSTETVKSYIMQPV